VDALANLEPVLQDPNPSAAIMDTQSTMTTEEGGRSSGYDAHKNVKGRKRHLLVDTLGLSLSVYVTPADVQDRAGARLLLAGLKPLLPRLKKIQTAPMAARTLPSGVRSRESGSLKLSSATRRPKALRLCRSDGS
jgi:hypothetical protein